MKIVSIVQARMGSTRLPGKVLKIVNGKPLLAYQIERMKRSKLIDELVIATTPYGNEPIIELCNQLGVPYLIGSEEDVLARYYAAAKEFEADVIVRMTSDCPVIDPKIIDSVIQFYIDGSFDYVSNTQIRTFPRGMDTEVFSMSGLEKAFVEAQLDYEREHVTPYFYRHPEQFEIGQYALTDEDNSHLRLTVDTQEDFELLSILISELYAVNQEFNLEMILGKFKVNPDLIKINEHIEQKKLGE